MAAADDEYFRSHRRKSTNADDHRRTPTITGEHRRSPKPPSRTRIRARGYRSVTPLFRDDHLLAMISHMADFVSRIDDLQERLRLAGYLADAATGTVVHLAAALSKPVLVEGPAGTGKTQLAKSVAAMTGRRADPPAVLRGPGRIQGHLRMGLPAPAAPAAAAPGQRQHGPRCCRNLRRGLPAEPPAAGRDTVRSAGSAADRRG